MENVQATAGSAIDETSRMKDGHRYPNDGWNRSGYESSLKKRIAAAASSPRGSLPAVESGTNSSAKAWRPEPGRNGQPRGRGSGQENSVRVLGTGQPSSSPNGAIWPRRFPKPPYEVRLWTASSSPGRKRLRTAGPKPADRTGQVPIGHLTLPTPPPVFARILETGAVVSNSARKLQAAYTTAHWEVSRFSESGPAAASAPARSVAFSPRPYGKPPRNGRALLRRFIEPRGTCRDLTAAAAVRHLGQHQPCPALHPDAVHPPKDPSWSESIN